MPTAISPSPSSSSNRPRPRVDGAATYLGVSTRSLASRAWRIKHGIPTLRVGRSVIFDPAALDAWLRRHEENGGER